MTTADLKRFDKRVREIQNPFGTGYPILRALAEKWAQEQGMSKKDFVRQYIVWKGNK